MKFQASQILIFIVVAVRCSAAPTLDYLGNHAHYIDLPRSPGARMFYFYFESRRSRRDPVVVWLNGGPGVGSEIGLLYENGPVTFSDNNSSLTWNNYGWDQVSNILFIDSPVGTGFSQVSDKKYLCRDEDCVASDLYDFLQLFFKKNRDLARNQFFITGESYAGHYIPALASHIHKKNKEGKRNRINLKGFAIGNGLTNPEIQYTAFPDYALKTGMIGYVDYKRIVKKHLRPCIDSIKSCNAYGGKLCDPSLCDYLFEEILIIAKDKNNYDIRKKCAQGPCLNFSSMVKFLNSSSARRLLGVGKGFEFDNTDVYDALNLGRMKNIHLGIPELIDEGIKDLIYAGEYDYTCNWMGNLRWVRALNWSGRAKFVTSRTVPFVVDGLAAGELNSYGSLAFLKVYDAGHTVPQDQPKASLEMVRKWMEGSLT